MDVAESSALEVEQICLAGNLDDTETRRKHGGGHGSNWSRSRSRPGPSDESDPGSTSCSCNQSISPINYRLTSTRDTLDRNSTFNCTESDTADTGVSQKCDQRQ